MDGDYDRPAAAGAGGVMAEYFADLQENQYTAEISATVQMIDGRFEELTVTPSGEAQTIEPDSGYAAFSRVHVNPIPQNWGLITWNGATLTVS